MPRARKDNTESKSNKTTQFIGTVVNVLKNKYAGVADDESQSGFTNTFLDTGSYMLNALVSGSLYKGLPGNHMTALAGPPSSGKTYFILTSIKRFLQEHENATVLFFETEGAVFREVLVDFGIDPSKVVVIPVGTVEEFRTQAVNLLNKFEEMKENDRPKILMILDSLGMLATKKELEDAASGSEKKDMTRAVLMRSTFRTITLKLRLLNIPLIFTNHTYAVPGQYVPTQAMSGGDGPVFSASVVLFLDNRREKDEKTKDVKGNLITCHLKKGRFTRDGKKVTIYLDHKRGCLRHYGMLDFGVSVGLLSKGGRSAKAAAAEETKPKKATKAAVEKESATYVFPDGTEAKAREVYADPEKFFTPELMKEFEDAVYKHFTFIGSQTDVPVDEDNDDYDATVEVDSDDASDE